jgi:hypothetical protein
VTDLRDKGHTHSRRSPVISTAGVLGLLLVSYVLCYGPVVYLAARGSLPDRFVDPLTTFYQPVYRWRTASGPINAPIKWYLRLWSSTPFEGDPETEEMRTFDGYSPLP